MGGPGGDSNGRLPLISWDVRRPKGGVRTYKKREDILHKKVVTPTNEIVLYFPSNRGPDESRLFLLLVTCLRRRRDRRLPCQHKKYQRVPRRCLNSGSTSVTNGWVLVYRRPKRGKGQSEGMEVWTLRMMKDPKWVLIPRSTIDRGLREFGQNNNRVLSGPYVLRPTSWGVEYLVRPDILERTRQRERTSVPLEIKILVLLNENVITRRFR